MIGRLFGRARDWTRSHVETWHIIATASAGLLFGCAGAALLLQHWATHSNIHWASILSAFGTTLAVAVSLFVVGGESRHRRADQRIFAQAEANSVELRVRMIDASGGRLFALSVAGSGTSEVAVFNGGSGPITNVELISVLIDSGAVNPSAVGVPGPYVWTQTDRIGSRLIALPDREVTFPGELSGGGVRMGGYAPEIGRHTIIAVRWLDRHGNTWLKVGDAPVQSVKLTS